MPRYEFKWDDSEGTGHIFSRYDRDKPVESLLLMRDLDAPLEAPFVTVPIGWSSTAVLPAEGILRMTLHAVNASLRFIEENDPAAVAK